MEELLDDIYNAFDPFQPLPPGDPVYVDLRAVRGDENIEVLGKRISRARRKTCQLYAGHRGAGKSTELLRLKKYLEERDFWVVYFAADEQDIDPEDTQYTDILLACTRHLLEDLKYASATPLLNWLSDRWQELKDLAQTEIEFESLGVEGQIGLFAKLTANLRAVPTLRHQIRSKVDPQTVTLMTALNEFIGSAKKKLPEGRKKLAVIVDNLDRMVPVIQESGRTNHEEIFIDRSEQLKALDCHLIYTVPISMVYSSRANNLREIYSDPQVLPMIMVQTISGEVYPPGFEKIKEVIAKRVRLFAPNISLETDIFDSAQTLQQLCLMSGGHVRNLLLLVQAAIDHTEDLPIADKAVRRSIADARDTYRRTVEDNQWRLLAEVAGSKQLRNDNDYRSLLFTRCILEYCFEEAGERQHWYDVHPLLRGVREFKEAVEQIKS